MTSKKDEEAKQAEQEAEIANLQNHFLTLMLVPKEFMELEELPISPAVHIDESAAPIEPPKPKQAQAPLERPKGAQAAFESSTRPSTAKPSLGAAESLLAGLVPSSPSISTQKPQSPESPEPSSLADTPPKEQQSITEKQENKSEYNPMSALLGGGASSQSKSDSPPENSSNKDEAQATESTSGETSGSSSEEAGASAQLTEENSIEPTEANPSPESPSNTAPRKEGVFSKAKSLFSNITKKDKKE